MRTKKIKDQWFCYGTIKGYDYSFEADTENNAILKAWQHFKLPYFDDVRSEITIQKS